MLPPTLTNRLLITELKELAASKILTAFMEGERTHSLQQGVLLAYLLEEDKNRHDL